MVETARRKGLGRGLAALIDDVKPATSSRESNAAQEAPIELLTPNGEQPRRRFDETEIDALAESIKAHGVIQPLIVRRRPDGAPGWQIVAGERRWRAAQRAGLHAIPIVERSLSDRDVLEIAIVENIQRADLTPLEEAAGYAQLIEKFGHTQDQLATALGKSRSHIANTLRLLQLPAGARSLLEAGTLTAGHARALLGAPDADTLAARVARDGLSVRETERLAAGVKGRDAVVDRVRRLAGGARKDPDTLALEADLSAALGLKVVLDHRDQSGTLRIQYATLEELDGLCQLLGRSTN